MSLSEEAITLQRLSLIHILEEQLKGIGYEVSKERGDYENGELTVDN